MRQLEVGMKLVKYFRERSATWSPGLVVIGGLAPLGVASTASAADHFVSSGTSNFNCASVDPGDTVTLASGPRGSLVIQNCSGASGRPILIRNDPRGTGPTQIRRSSGNAGGFVFNCINCVWTTIDGSSKWIGAPSGQTYGISVSMTGGGSPTAFIKISGVSRFLTIRNVEVNGAYPAMATDGIGISINDHDVTTSKYPGLWREGILLENNYVHNVQGEGMYVGPNWGKGDIPLRNIEIRNNRIETTGWDGIQLKSAISGTNEIHHNVIKRVGQRVDSFGGQHYGISIYEGNGKIYNNWVERSGEAGISHYIHHMPSSYGSQVSEIFNNIVVDAGQTGPNAGHGIVSANASGTARTLPHIYNNTVIRAKDIGIKVGSGAAGGYVRDNIVADSARTAISAPSNVGKINNRTGSVSQMGFAGASSLNFKLTSSSAARNAGSKDVGGYDFDGVARPQEGAGDQGAFEFDVGDKGDARPNPPVITSIN
jgi:hypothetical protein